MILPSLLEYSAESLQSRLDLLKKNSKTIYPLQKTHRLSLHLDFVLPQFAKDRSVMTSLGLPAVFDALKSNFHDHKLELSIHLMGETEDLLEGYNFFQDYPYNPNWNYLILIPEKYLNIWQKSIKNGKKNVTIGCWYDLDEWADKTFVQKRTNLLMTVVAGKSGQKLEDNTKEKALQINKKHPTTHFILDGGWPITTKSNHNTDIVSYSSFWNNLNK
jgi:pentose-5-phosphate-3-epimerase